MIRKSLKDLKMDIKTKYSVGEKVFVMYKNRILNQFINKIEKTL